MKRIGVVFTLAVACCLVFVLTAEAKGSDEKKVSAIPIWKITQDETNKSIEWVDATNKRFAVYDAGTPSDETDDVVLDKETGLVWERSPDIVAHSSWTNACNYCIIKELANRKGWRPPTIEELASLVDNDDYNPPLPPGHPFINVQPYYYWSSTTWTGDAGKAWAVVFTTGYLYQHFKDGSIKRYVWCVRGGQGHDGY